MDPISSSLPSQDRPTVPVWVVAVAAAIIAAAFTWSTNQAWEDFWITYKSSKNLATGWGLVFHHGEKVHTFTSPLGVLLPALTCLLTGTQSDQAALWLYRIITIAGLAAGTALMYATMRALRWHNVAIALTLGIMITDAKTIDFSTNGMETGLLLGFIAYTVWSMFACTDNRRWLHLGLAWGGLMWTRPDGFIYIGTLAIAGWALRIRDDETRRDFFNVCVRAALVCTVVYLPWFLWAWSYYGTPVPNTISAKSGVAGPRSSMGALMALVKFPSAFWEKESPVQSVLLPSNSNFGSWPIAIMSFYRCATCLVLLLWVIPQVRKTSKALLVSAFVFVYYLCYFPNYPACWYFPGPAWLMLMGLGGILSQLWLVERANRFLTSLRWAVTALASAFLLCGMWMTVQTARQLSVEQRIIDGGNRRSIGLWLKEHAKPGDTVFMECLGYIGYYSELKTYDFPGLSSPEMVKAIKEVGPQWDKLIRKMKPTWIAMRPQEFTQVMQSDPELLSKYYQAEKVFDVSGEVERLQLQGHSFVSFDSIFLIMHRTDEMAPSAAQL